MTAWCSQTDALGRRWEFAYDAADQRIRTITPGGQQYDVDRDANGNATGVHAPGGANTAMTYDALDRFASYVAPGAGGALAQSYDADRAPVRRTLPGGRHVDTGYDAGGRPTSVTSPEAAVAISYVGATDRVASSSRTPVAGGAQATAYEYQGDLLTRRNVTGAADRRRALHVRQRSRRDVLDPRRRGGAEPRPRSRRADRRRRAADDHARRRRAHHRRDGRRRGGRLCL